MKKNIFLLLLLMFCNILIAQNNFRLSLQKTNPVKNDNAIGTAASIKSHEIFLKNAIATKNDLHQLYGLLYLYKDYSIKSDFVKAVNYLYEAEKFAKESKKQNWIGPLMVYRASVTASIEKNLQLSIVQFKQAIKKCSEVKDSLCMAEGYEQLSTKYNALGDYKKAHYFFKLAISLFRKHGTSANLSIAYSNYANVLCNEKNFTTAIRYIDSAVVISVKNKKLHDEVVFRSNMAATYIDLKQYDKALSIYDYCEPISSKNNWTDNLTHTYFCRAVIYEKQGKFQQALEYLNRHYSLKENTTGEKVQSKIAALEEKYKKEEQQLILKKKEIQLMKSRRLVENYSWFGFSMLIFLVLGMSFWRVQSLRNKKTIAENKNNLAEITQLLIAKNALLMEYEEKINKKVTLDDTSNELESSLYNLRILTDLDWTSFKTYFEKAYPNYLKKIRETYLGITDAEERLFLCIKINLKSNEIASMLGISKDSVKKNRNRLRKRLNLDEKVDLTVFIREFNNL